MAQRSHSAQQASLTCALAHGTVQQEQVWMEHVMWAPSNTVHPHEYLQLPVAQSSVTSASARQTPNWPPSPT